MDCEAVRGRCLEGKGCSLVFISPYLAVGEPWVPATGRCRRGPNYACRGPRADLKTVAMMAFLGGGLGIEDRI